MRLFYLGAVILWLCASQPTLAQQNLFNIPSGDITPTGEFFVQQQTNLYTAYELETKLHAVYGIAERLDAGINLLNVAWNTQNTRDPLEENYRDLRLPQAPLVMGTVQYAQPLPAHLQLNVGAQAGLNVLAPDDSRHLATNYYGLLMYKSGDVRLLAGGYWANAAFAGAADQGGLLLGGEWHCFGWGGLMGDAVGGPNKLAATVLGAYVNVGKYVQLCGGLLLQDLDNKLMDGFVLEVNIFTWDWQARRHAH
jgi:hypothetical protein